MDTTYIVWLVRVLLPILLFWIWYSTQPNKGPLWSAPGERSYTRQSVLAAREALKDEPAPDSLQTLKLVDDTHLQKVFGNAVSRSSGPARRDPNAKKDKRTDKGGDKASARNIDGKQRSQSRDGVEAETGEAEVVASAATENTTPAKDEGALSVEEKMHLEALLNFVAFSYKDSPQRIYLPLRPPPPPRRPSSRPSCALEGPLDEVDSSETAKTNTEAQYVLKGLLNPKLGLQPASRIPKELHRQFLESVVPPQEGTFSLMVEACVGAGDLRGASDFLMMMESAGHSAASDLLDKVMDLYSESRTGDENTEPALKILENASGLESTLTPSPASALPPTTRPPAPWSSREAPSSRSPPVTTTPAYENDLDEDFDLDG